MGRSKRGILDRGEQKRKKADDREMVWHLGDYADRDTELYAAAVQLYEERLAAARQGETCI